MPRIKAATVVEHRAAQRRALLDAARALVLSGGASTLTFGELADRAGLARPSVYEYFKTRADLVSALMDEELPRWQEEVSSKIAGVSEPRHRIEAFLRAHLELVAAGRHEVAFALAGADMDATTRAEIELRHRKALEMLGSSLERLGLPTPLVLPLIASCLSTATGLVRGDRSATRTIDAAIAFVLAGLDGVGQALSGARKNVRPKSKRANSRGPR